MQVGVVDDHGGGAGPHRFSGCNTTSHNSERHAAIRRGVSAPTACHFYQTTSSARKANAASPRTRYQPFSFSWNLAVDTLTSVWGAEMAELLIELLQQGLFSLLPPMYTMGHTASSGRAVTSFLVPFMRFLQEVRVELIGTVFSEEIIIRAENQGPGKVTLQLSGRRGGREETCHEAVPWEGRHLPLLTRGSVGSRGHSRLGC